MKWLIALVAVLALIGSGCKDKKTDAKAADPAVGEKGQADDEAVDEGEADDDEDEAAEDDSNVRRLGPEGQKIKMINKPQQVGEEVEGLLNEGVKKRDGLIQER